MSAIKQNFKTNFNLSALQSNLSSTGDVSLDVEIRQKIVLFTVVLVNPFRRRPITDGPISSRSFFNARNLPPRPVSLYLCARFLVCPASSCH